MPAFLFQAPAGFPGDITRIDESNVEPLKFAEADCPAVFGFPYVFDASGNPVKWSGSNVAADFAGILVREVPAEAGGVASDASFEGQPLFSQPLGGLVRGYMAVKCASGTPKRGGTVYVQVTANGGVAVGEFRADSDGGNSVALSSTQATWASNGVNSTSDSLPIAEIRIAR